MPGRAARSGRARAIELIARDSPGPGVYPGNAAVHARWYLYLAALSIMLLRQGAPVRGTAAASPPSRPARCLHSPLIPSPDARSGPLVGPTVGCRRGAPVIVRP